MIETCFGYQLSSWSLLLNAWPRPSTFNVLRYFILLFHIFTTISCQKSIKFQNIYQKVNLIIKMFDKVLILCSGVFKFLHTLICAFRRPSFFFKCDINRFEVRKRSVKTLCNNLYRFNTQFKTAVCQNLFSVDFLL